MWHIERYGYVKSDFGSWNVEEEILKKRPVERDDRIIQVESVRVQKLDI